MYNPEVKAWLVKEGYANLQIIEAYNKYVSFSGGTIENIRNIGEIDSLISKVGFVVDKNGRVFKEFQKGNDISDIFFVPTQTVVRIVRTTPTGNLYEGKIEYFPSLDGRLVPQVTGFGAKVLSEN